MITKKQVEEAREEYLAAKNITTYQKKKQGGQDWFPLWLDYLSLRNQYREQMKEQAKCVR